MSQNEYIHTYSKDSGRKQQKERLLKNFFPSIESRLAVNLKVGPNVTTIMTGHGIFDLICID